jgi:hypothetical protein
MILTFDGNTEGKEVHGDYVKISDEPIDVATVEEIGVNFDGEIVPIGIEDLSVAKRGISVLIQLPESEPIDLVLVINEDGYIGNNLFSKGTYVAVSYDGAVYPTKIVYNNGEEPTSPTLDPTSLLMGWLVGESVKAMLSKQKEPVAYLYNGVRLPALPEWDKSKYPYAYLLNLPGGYYCYVQDKPGYSKNDGRIYTAIGTNMREYELTNGKWEFTADILWDIEEKYSFYESNLFIWVSSDIFDTDGTVCFTASEPIPVYE